MLPPLVLVPGLACTPRLFAPLVDVLGQDAISVQIAEHLGPDTIGEIADQILAASPPYFALAGLSMGGYIALEMALRAPDRVNHLGLFNTKISPDSPEKAASRRELIALAEDSRFEDVIDRLLPAFLHPARLEDADLVATVRAMAHDVGPDRFIAQERALLSRENRLQQAAKLEMPTLVIAGDADQLMPADAADEIRRTIPHATLVTIETCGHLSTLERPVAVAHAIADWLGLPLAENRV
ncbi:alpha/beta fold hydrolase [Amorphus sp. 3PC139-8]|uniref:alpha/beta fold hydrolase n=1 Tax=Amorphus sp. 3PC139-8 TaxID=2735676 RepID=UPI00345D6E36